MGGVQIMIRRKVHTTPLGVLRWDGTLGAHPRGQ